MKIPTLLRQGASAALISIWFGVGVSSSATVQHRTHSTLQMKPCRVGGSAVEMRCGTYFAPEDPDRPNGRRIPLKVIVVPARDGRRHLDPILIFAGGPGEAATNDAADLADGPERAEHDIVLIDQRGTGEGNRLPCPGPGNDADYGTWLESAYRAPYPQLCRRKLETQVNLGLYTTAVAMRDYDAVRALLGYEKVNVQGGSYGSRAALVYMKMFGGHVHAALVSALVPFEAKLPLYHPRGAQDALNRIFAECRSDARCSSAFPDPAGDFAVVRERLRTQPARVTLKLEDKTTVPVTITEQRLLNLIRFMLYSLSTQRQIPLALHRAAAGDFSIFAAGAAFARHGNTEIASGMALSATCSEDVARIRPSEITLATRGTFLGSRFVTERIAACSHWAKGRLLRDEFSPFVRSFPVLLVTGTHDPVTPEWMSLAYRRHFPNSRHVFIPAGHSLPPGSCFSSLELQLFDKGDVNAIDATCIGKMETPPFRTD